MSQQVPPHDLPAENALLGALLLAPRRVMKQIGTLDPEDFYDPGNRLVYSAITDYLNSYPQEDPQQGISIPLVGILRERGDLDKIGGPSKLIKLQNECPNTSGAAAYARRIRTEAGKFKLLEAARAQAKDVKGQKDLAQSLIDAKKRLDDIVAHTDLGRALRTGEQTIDAFLDLKEQKGLGEVKGISTGFGEIDKIIGRLRGGDTYVIGGRTGQGKTALAMAMGLNALHQGHPVLFVSLEMSETNLVERVMSNLADVNNTHLRDVSPESPLSHEEEVRLSHAVTQYLQLPLTVHDESFTTVSRIGGLARLAGIGDGRGLIIVDYIQLLSPEAGASHGTRQEEIANHSRALKLVARDLNCAILILCQLRDAPEGLNPVPVLNDLRESRAPGNDASAVLLVHRPKMDEEVDSGEFDIYVRKNRNGPADRRVELIFIGSKMRFGTVTPAKGQLKLVPHRPDPVYKFGKDEPKGAGAAAHDALMRKRAEREAEAQRNGQRE